MSNELIGKEIGRYKILELTGEGGLATVYKALDTRLDREVALKVIRREVFAPNEMSMLLKRFEREAKSLGRLSHPNLVPVIDYGEFEGAPYLVMVYLPGGTLKNLLSGPIPWRDAIQLLLPIAKALEYVHNRNIIHRDVKPSNILLTENGEPLLTDFGLAKLFGEKGDVETDITASGQGLGSPDYMAPEQWTGEATAQSDLYSLGTVLYEMITGHRPYIADTPAGILLKQANGLLPRPKSYISDLPQDVESVLLKVLANDPAKRYGNMHDFTNELENLLAGQKASPPTFIVARLREQLKEKIVGHPSPSDVAPAPLRKKWTLANYLVSTAGRLVLLVVAFSCWLLTLLLLGEEASQVLLIGILLTASTIILFAVARQILKWREKRYSPVEISKSLEFRKEAREEMGSMTLNMIAVLEPQQQGKILTLINRDHELRIKDILVHFGGGRYLFHGFGRFGRPR